MNISFLSIVCFMTWMLFLYIRGDDYLYIRNLRRDDRDLSSDMLYLSVSFMGLIIAPIINVLNAAVTTNELLGEGCKQKLSFLQLKLTMEKN